ncbi:hypothetical protein ACFY0A_37350 [Streptomyces sp. NPDC001698]|uniref:hypothetical protein n=1 Tax=Streptomyces sp. NPDC001698 TaxID=3364601 RepID=UPI0036B5F321
MVRPVGPGGRAESKGLVAEIDGLEVEVPAYDPAKPDETAPVAIRVWESHPARAIEADSPVRAALDLLEELALLNAAVAAIARSRLTGRGLVIVLKGARFPDGHLVGLFLPLGQSHK